MRSLPVEAGSTLGTYVLERKLGAGGMAEVYLARRSGPHGFQKRVAIKRILPELAEDSQLIQMFCDEARVAATLSHPNIVQIVEFGEEGGELYIVMEFVDGVSCGTLLRAANQKGRALPVGPALYIAREVLVALAFAHEARDEHERPLRVVHRDVSPSNILVSRVGNVKLIDFGITRSLLAERRTFPGELKGKVRYLSPEQILGAEADARSDLYAVGVVLAEMLTGRALFTGKSDLDVLARISRGEKGLVNESDVPPDLVLLLTRALARRPEERFQTARDFARALEDAAAARDIRLDDTAIVPYLHAEGVLPSSSGTRPRTTSDAPTAPTGVNERLVRASLPSELPAPRVPGAAEGAERRRRAPSGTYRLRTRTGETVGPLPRSEMLALLATGRLSARSHVSLSADAFVAAGTVPALSALAAHPAYRFREDDDASPEWLTRIEGAAVPGALYRLVLERRTGLLAAVDGKRRKRIFFDRGLPVFVASTDRDELLGRRLVAAGVVTEDAVDLALGRQPPLRVGEALVSFGAIGGGELVRELARQLEERVIGLGEWRSGELRFFGDRSLDASLHVRTREPPLHLAARLVRAAFAPGDVAALLRPFTKQALTLAPSARKAIPLLGLTLGEGTAVALAAEASSVRDVVTRATGRGSTMAEALIGLFIGLSAGILELPGWPSRPA